MNGLPSVMSHTFSEVPAAEIQRSHFDRSHGRKMTFSAGYLVPFYADEVLPGDTFNLNTTFIIRLNTPWKPLMDNLYADTFFFFDPNRLLWTNWQKFCGEQTNPGDSTSYSIPYIASPTTPGIATHSLGDYFGLPVGLANSFNFNSLHFRAYNHIWNQWFRSENLQNSVTVDVGDGPDTYGNYVLLKRGKRFDYFTSCLPWPQKGTAVSIPLGTTAPVIGLGKDNRNYPNSNVNVYETDATSTTTYTNASYIDNSADHVLYARGSGATNATLQVYADLTNATAATINSLRQAFQLQKLYERDARGGTRYTEIVRSHFGVISPDARLQRPEYLGGGSTPINLTPVAQTTAQSTPTNKDGQGNLAAFGVGVGTNHGFTKSFTEHGVVIGLICVRADLTYQQGLNRMWSRRTRFDYYWPALAHIGEQAVLNKEIYCQGDGNDSGTFGYQERFAEYRYKPSEITGLFRTYPSSGNTTIDFWHLSQNFGSLPTLADTFIQETPPMSRVVQVTSQPDFMADMYLELHCARPMPVYGVPGLIDHF